jgi:hypothetical protein
MRYLSMGPTFFIPRDAFISDMGEMGEMIPVNFVRQAEKDGMATLSNNTIQVSVAPDQNAVCCFCGQQEPYYKNAIAAGWATQFRACINGPWINSYVCNTCKDKHLMYHEGSKSYTLDP